MLDFFFRFNKTVVTLPAKSLVLFSSSNLHGFEFWKSPPISVFQASEIDDKIDDHSLLSSGMSS